MNKRLRFGIAGCGNFGKHMGEYLLEVAEVVAVCDAEVERARDAARHLDLNIPAYGDYREMIDAGELDAVAVTAANFAHAEITIAAADAGLHVFCEKAMARTVPECWDMVAACLRNDVKLMVGHKRRLRPPWSRMIELTDDTLLGEVLAVSVVQYADMRPYDTRGTWWDDPALSGGFLASLGVHVVDWFRAVCGDARRVTAAYGPRQDPSCTGPDILHANYLFESGAVATINGAMAFPLQLFREAQGPWAQCRNGGFRLVPELDHIDLFWQRLDDKEAHHERFDDLGFNHAFRLEVGDFVRWVTDERPPCLTWVEGLRCVEMMEAAYRSANAGGEPVDLPLYPELEKAMKEEIEGRP